MDTSEFIAGYDPGGNGAHGVAILEVRDSRLVSGRTTTLQTTEDVLRLLEAHDRLSAIGVDTLTCWCTGNSGWRPADTWLRNHNQPVAGSIVSPNGLYGSMGLNGMAVLLAARKMNPSIFVTETHPKVLYYSLTGNGYDHNHRTPQMNAFLSRCLGIEILPANDHEWDAAISAYAAHQGKSGQWTEDLHSLKPEDGSRLIFPCGVTQYVWPGGRPGDVLASCTLFD